MAKKKQEEEKLINQGKKNLKTYSEYKQAEENRKKGIVSYSEYGKKQQDNDERSERRNVIDDFIGEIRRKMNGPHKTAAKDVLGESLQTDKSIDATKGIKTVRPTVRMNSEALKPDSKTPMPGNYAQQVVQKQLENEDQIKWNNFLINTQMPGRTGAAGVEQKDNKQPNYAAVIGKNSLVNAQKRAIISEDPVLKRAAAKDYAANKPQEPYEKLGIKAAGQTAASQNTAKQTQQTEMSRAELLARARERAQQKTGTDAVLFDALAKDYAANKNKPAPTGMTELKLPEEEKEETVAETVPEEKKQELSRAEILANAQQRAQAKANIPNKTLYDAIVKENAKNGYTEPVQPGMTGQKTKTFSDRVADVDKLVTGKMERADWWGETPDTVNEMLGESRAKAARVEIEALKKRGQFDDPRYDPRFWSDQYQEEMLDRINEDALQRQATVDKLTAQLAEEKKSGSLWSPLLDLYQNDKAEKWREIIAGEGYTEEKKANAQRELDRVYRSVTVNGKSAYQRAEEFYRLYETNSELNMDTMRQQAYDAMNGLGAYRQKMAQLNWIEQETFNKHLDQALSDMMDPEKNTGKKLRSEQALLDYDNTMIDKILGQNQWEQNYNDIMSGIEFTGAQYDPAKDIVPEGQKFSDKGWNPYYSNVDIVYAVIGGRLSDEAITDGDFHEAALMNGVEKDHFLNLYLDGKKDEAWAFYQGIQPMLNETYNLFETMSMQNKAKQLPVLSSIGTFIATIAQPAEFMANIPNVARTLLGEEKEIMDPKGDQFYATRLKNTTRQTITSDLEKTSDILARVYGGAMSGGDSTLNFLISKAIGLPDKLLQPATLYLFSEQAFQTSLQQSLTEHKTSHIYDIVEASLDALIETATELVTVELLMAEPTNIVRFGVKAAVSEPSEELVGAIAEPYIKELAGHQHQYKARAAEIYANGGYYDSKGNFVNVNDIDEANRQAMREWNRDGARAALEALFSVGPTIGYQGTRMALGNIQTGRMITGDSTTAEERAGRLLDIADTMGPESDSAKRAAKMRAKGKTQSNYQLGQLAQDTMREAAEAHQPEKVVEVVDTLIPEGEKNGKTHIRMATQQESDDAQGTKVAGARGVILNRKDGTSQHARVVGIRSVYNDKTKQRDIKVELSIAGEKDNVTVDPSELLSTNYSGAVLLTRMQNNPWLYSPEFTNIVLDEMDKDENAAHVVAPLAESIRLAALTKGTMPKTGLSEESAQRIWDETIKEQKAVREKDRKGQYAQMPGRGTVVYKGAYYGTDKFQEMLKNDKLSSKTRQMIGIVAEFAKRAGVDVVLMDQEEMEAERKAERLKYSGNLATLWGIEGQETEEFRGIVLNIEGQKTAGDVKGSHNLLVTFGHEFAHWLQRHSGQGYDNLEQFIIQEQRKALGGQAGLNGRLLEIMRNKQISVFEAMSELVADSCDQILSNEKMIQHVQQVNQSLYGQIKEFAKGLITRIRTVLSDMLGSMSDDARNVYKQIYEQNADRIAELFNLAWDEASQKYYEKLTVKLVEENKIQAAETEAETAAEEKKIRIFNPYTGEYEYIKKGESLKMPDEEGAPTRKSSAEQDSTKWKLVSGRNGEYYEVDQQTGERTKLTGDDAEYVAAWKRGDYRTMEEILAKKIREQGAIPFKTPNSYSTANHRWVANAIKEGNMTAIRQAAAEMAEMVPDNAVLVPMPNHHGVVDDSTDTMILAQEISKLTGRPVIKALEGIERESRQQDKGKPKSQQMTAEDLGFRQAAEIPEGMVPYFVDNVIASGLTAEAAHRALGNNGVTIAYAKSTRSANDGLKRANATFYDTNKQYGNYLIPLSERINMERTGYEGVKYSSAESEEERSTPVVDADGNEIAVELPGGTIAATRYSYASFIEEKERKKMIAALQKAGYSEEEIKNWMKDLDNIANLIATNRTLYDFVADRSKKFLKENGDVYKKTLDASTMCRKTRLYNGTFNLVQHMLPNTILLPEDLIDLYNIMKGMNLETPCGLCYVQSRRRLLGQYTEEWLKTYDGEYIPSVDEVTTSDGLEQLKKDHPQTYTDFVEAMNKKGVNNPKLVQQRTDYRGDIRKLKKQTIAYLKKIGGLRIQSFSDFEIVHMLDMMQAVMDMKAVGLTAQAYTKVPEFAWVFGPTGIKINLSLLGKGTGLDANGNLVFDDDEGMPIAEALALRKAYGKNVGTILVGINDEHIIAAMGDGRIDFIIPFHKSGWSENELKKMSTLKAYKDYTETQNEYEIVGTDENGNLILKKAESNIDPLSYWNFELSGEQNARIYLEECAKQGIVPKFRQFLVDNGDGTYSLPEGNGQRETNIRKGYWKLLIDFKMYDNEGKGSPQMEVEPNFNMEKATELLNKYDGSHRELPESREAAVKFVEQYKAAHPLDEVRTRYSSAEEDAIDVEAWMESRTEGSFRTEDERVMWRTWKRLRNDVRAVQFRIQEYRKQIKALEAIGEENLTAEERDQLRELNNKLFNKTAQLDKLEKQLRKTTSTEGFATMMRNANMVIGDFMAGRTQDQVTAAVDRMTGEVEAAEKEMAKQEKALQKLGQESAVKTVRAQLRYKGLTSLVSALKTQYGTTMSRDELEGRVAEIILKSLKGEDVTEEIEALANDVATRQNGIGNVAAEEALSQLRGRTIVIGPGQRAELKANNLTLNELRQRIKGSGIKLVYGDTSTLDTDAEEIVAEVPGLQGQLDNEKASLENFISFVENMLSLKKGSAADSGIDTEEVEAFIGAMAVNMLNEDVGGMKKEDLIAKIKADAGRIGSALAAVRAIRQGLKTVKASGEKAQTWSGVLRQDMETALDYYDKVARMAAQQERQSVRKSLIEQLEAENTKKLLAQQQYYREMMKSDRNAREMANDIMTLRSKINTTVKRVSRLLTQETDLKNIPEEAKPLARLLIKMFVLHDINYRQVTFSDNKQLERAAESLHGWQELFGDFDFEHDLDWLIIGEGTDADYEIRDKIEDALKDIEVGLMEYRNAKGKRNVALQDRKAALEKVQKAVSTVWNVINAQRNAVINGQRLIIDDLAKSAADEMQNSRFKGEWAGKGVRGWLARNVAGQARTHIVYANMTPVYFFKNLKNSVMSLLFGDYQRSENRNGLEIAKAKARLEQIAQEAGYSTWDRNKRYTVELEKGGTVQLTLGEMMSLYAIWQREDMNQKEKNGPEKSFHLAKGGFYVAEDLKEGEAGRRKLSQKAHRLTENDIATIKGMMTPKQLEYVEKMVSYITNEIGELGNEASMKMYGIRKFNEKWYFPMESWNGVLRSKSTAGTQQSKNAAAHQSHTIRRANNAKNALVIRDFTQTVVKHIVAQINYNTFAPSIEWMQRVMNTKLTDVADEEISTQRNLWAMFQEAYGTDAYKYLKRFQQDMNGGATQNERTLYDKLISTFRKNAVAGSLSVALQQPLSYIRAAMVISPKWLTLAMNPKYYKGSAAEMEAHSGVAVLKRMGKFDMGIGASAQSYIAPDAKQSAGRKVYEGISDLATALPELMDRVTWTRLWTAAKLEQASLHPDMDQKSDEFLQLVAERFNDIIRTTQVYDSTLVRSQNMRSQNPFTKSLTSFMAEPTLTANILADSVMNANEKGGKMRIAKAGATYMLSAVMQALVKGLMAAGRNPDKKKTWDENAAYRFLYNFMSEANPVSLIPGYSNLVSLLKDGELSDNAFGMIGKFFEAGGKTYQLVTGKSEDIYRSIEDSAGVLAQLFTNIPVKNIMRDVRAMINFFTQPYAQRENNTGVLKYQTKDMLYSNELLGAINSWLGKDGYQATMDAYAQRIYDAEKRGNETAVKEMSDYVTLVKSSAEDPEKALQQKLNAIAKKDDDLSATEKAQYLMDNGAAQQSVTTFIMDQVKSGDMTLDEARKALKENGSTEKTINNYITDRLKAGEITADEARKLLKENNPKKSADDIWWQVDRVEWTKEKNLEESVSGQYYRLYDAISNNKSDQISKAVKIMLQHGMKKENIKKQLTDKYKDEYLNGTTTVRIRIRNALEMAYKALGYSKADADKIIDGWKKKK